MSDARIPVIDLAGAAGSEHQRQAIARQLVDAAVKHGFLYLRNTGREIPVAAVEEIFSISRKLFALPLVDKDQCRIGTDNRGWLGQQVETLDPKTQKAGDSKEAFNFGEFLDGHAQQPIPAALTADESHLAAFFDYCYRLCLIVNDLLGIGLEVNPPDFFTAAHRKDAGPAGNTLRLLYYPPRRPDDPEPVRAGAHSDYGSMTLLFRLPGQTGLEILPAGTSTWSPVPVSPPGTDSDPAPPILVNIGDLLAYWTGGLLRSTVHRVALPPTDSTVPRYSIAFFCHPADASPLSPVPSRRVAEAVARTTVRPSTPTSTGSVPSANKVLTAKEHLQMRLRATYLDLYST